MSQTVKHSKSRNQKQQEIFQVALKLFAHYGYKKTTIEDIALEMGMTKSNIYFYVSNKKDLYEKTVGNELIRWRDSIADEVAMVDDAIEKFKVMTTRAFEYLLSHKELRAILMKDPSIFTLSKEDDRFYEINLGAMGLIKKVLKLGVQQGKFSPIDIDVTTELLFSIYIMFLIKTYMKSEGNSASQMYEKGVTLLLYGLCKSKPY